MADEEAIDLNFTAASTGALFDMEAEGERIRADILLERERCIERLHYLTGAYTKGREYTQMIVAAGYVAFGALWAGVAKDVPPAARLISGGLLGVSLLLFVAWEIYKMWANQREGWRIGNAITGAASREELAAKIREADAEITFQDAITDRIWPWFFYPSLVSALVGSVILTGAALVTGGYMVWEQQKGPPPQTEQRASPPLGRRIDGEGRD